MKTVPKMTDQLLVSHIEGLQKLLNEAQKELGRRFPSITVDAKVVRDRTSYGFQESLKIQSDALKKYEGQMVRVTVEIPQLIPDVQETK